MLVGCTSLCADIRLPKIFSDKMVLQHGDTVRIWGTADPQQELEISLGENSTSTVADAEGNWSAEVVPPAVGGPYELKVAGAESRVVFNDVYVGEVWLCSGQSNMQWSIKQSVDFESDEQRDAYLAEIKNQNIRLFTVPPVSIDEPASDFAEAVAWEECRGEAAAEFSATAYFFAVALQKYEKFNDVPIGLIDASWGGTPAESWTSMDALKNETGLEPLLTHWNENQENRSPSRPACLFNGMVAPMIPYTIRGVVWYQGEANVGRGQQYQTIFPALINDWRARFGNDEMPFYYVQLAPHRYGNRDPRALPELWDAQFKALQVPHTGMAGSSDIGDPEDIHPKNKEMVGERLARVAMARSYGEAELESSGPSYQGMDFSEDKKRIIIKFSHATGLKVRGDSLSGFLICGKDGEFKPAQAEIDGETVVVWSEEIDQPAHVRFLWDDTAVGCLFNGADLPAFPFRTDDFELLSVDKNF